MPAARLPTIAVIDRDHLTAFGLSLLLRDWGYACVTGASATEIFGRTEARGMPIAAIVADDRVEDGRSGEDEAGALAALAERTIPIIVLASAGAAADAAGAARLPRPVEPIRLRDLLRRMVISTP